MMRRVLGLALCLPFLVPAPIQAQDAELAARFIAEMRANGCTMTETEADTILGAAGFSRDQTQEIAGVLLEAGLALLSDDWSTLVLDEVLCGADPAGDADAFNAALASLPPPPPPPAAPDPQELADMLRNELGVGFVRAMMEFEAEAAACHVDLTDPAAARAGIIAAMSHTLHLIYGLPDAPLEEPAAGELASLVDAFLADPGPFFEVEPGRLVLIGCTP